MNKFVLFLVKIIALFRSLFYKLWRNSSYLEKLLTDYSIEHYKGGEDNG